MTRAKLNSIEPDPDYYLNFSTYMSDQQWAVIPDQATYTRGSMPRECDSGEQSNVGSRCFLAPGFPGHSQENVNHVIRALFPLLDKTPE